MHSYSVVLLAEVYLYIRKHVLEAVTQKTNTGPPKTRAGPQRDMELQTECFSDSKNGVGFKHPSTAHGLPMQLLRLQNKVLRTPTASPGDLQKPRQAHGLSADVSIDYAWA